MRMDNRRNSCSIFLRAPVRPMAESRFIDNLIPPEEKLLLVTWVKKYRKNKEEKRLLIITEFRLFSCKKHKLTQMRTVQREGHFLHLKDFTMPKNNTIRLKFGAFNVMFNPPDVGKMVEALTGALSCVIGGFPISELPRVDVAPMFEERNAMCLIPEQTTIDTFINAYRSLCCLESITPNKKLIQFLQANTKKEKHLDLRDFLFAKTLDLKPLLMALRHDSFFKALFLNISAHGRDMISMLEMGVPWLTNVKTRTLEISCSDGEGLGEWSTHWLKNRQLALRNIKIHAKPGKNAVAFCKSFAHLSTPLETLNLSDCALSSPALCALFENLKENRFGSSSLMELHLEHSEMDIDATKSFCELVEKMGRTALLHTVHFGFSSPSAFLLLPTLSRCLYHTLESLDMSGYKFEEESVEILFESIISFTQLHTLVLSSCNINERFAEKIMGGIAENTKLRRVKVDLSRNWLGKHPEELPRLRQTIRRTVNLYELHLTHNPMRIEDWPVLLEAFAKHESVGCLHFSSFKSYDDSKRFIEYLSDLLQKKPLESLTLAPLDKNSNFSKSLDSLCLALERNRPLRALDIRGNGLGSNILALFECLASNKNLLHLQMDGNMGTLKLWQRLFEVLKNENNSVASVDMPRADIAKFIGSHPDQCDATQSLWKDIHALLDDRRKTSKPFQHYRMSLGAQKQTEMEATLQAGSLLEFNGLFQGFIEHTEECDPLGLKDICVEDMNILYPITPFSDSLIPSNTGLSELPTLLTLPNQPSNPVEPLPSRERNFSLCLSDFNDEVAMLSSPSSTPSSEKKYPTMKHFPSCNSPRRSKTLDDLTSYGPSRSQKKVDTSRGLFDSIYGGLDINGSLEGTEDPLFIQETCLATDIDFDLVIPETHSSFGSVPLNRASQRKYAATVGKKQNFFPTENQASSSRLGVSNAFPGRKKEVGRGKEKITEDVRLSSGFFVHKMGDPLAPKREAPLPPVRPPPSPTGVVPLTTSPRTAFVSPSRSKKVLEALAPVDMATRSTRAKKPQRAPPKPNLFSSQNVILRSDRPPSPRIYHSTGSSSTRHGTPLPVVPPRRRASTKIVPIPPPRR